MSHRIRLAPLLSPTPLALLVILVMSAVYWGGASVPYFLMDWHGEGSLANKLAATLLWPLGHASFGHWAVNMLMLFAFASAAERDFGARIAWLGGLGACLLIGGVHALGTESSLIGASVLAYWALGLTLGHRIRFATLALPFLGLLALVAGIEAWLLLAGERGAYVHLLGLIAGVHVALARAGIAGADAGESLE